MHNLFPAEKRVKKIIQKGSVLLFAELGRMTPTIRPDHLSGLLHGKKGNHLMGGCPFCIWGLDMQIAFGYFQLTRAKQSDLKQANY